MAWVAGLGGALVLFAGILWIRSRCFRDAPEQHATYREAGTPRSNDAAEVRALAVILLVVCFFSQLLYVGMYVELVLWLLGAREKPRIEGDLYAWVLLIAVTCAGASLYTAWKEHPTKAGR